MIWRVREIWRDYAWLPPVVIGGLAGLAALVTVLILREPRPTVVLEADRQSAEHEIVVLVEGAVHDPGVILIASDGTVRDAIERAGGPDAGADLSLIELDEPVSHGMRIDVPFRSSQRSNLVDVNSASAAELETLPGIGPVIAQRIIEHRRDHGPFLDIEELAEVSGISERMVGELRPYATASGR